MNRKRYIVEITLPDDPDVLDSQDDLQALLQIALDSWWEYHPSKTVRVESVTPGGES